MGLEPEQDEEGDPAGSGLRHWDWDSDQIYQVQWEQPGFSLSVGNLRHGKGDD